MSEDCHNPDGSRPSCSSGSDDDISPEQMALRREQSNFVMNGLKFLISSFEEKWGPEDCDFASYALFTHIGSTILAIEGEEKFKGYVDIIRRHNKPLADLVRLLEKNLDNPQ